MAIVGPGTQKPVIDDIRPLLEGASEYEYVTVLNPLTDDFMVRVAQDVSVNTPVTISNPTTLVQNESDIVRNYGFGLKGKDFQARKHVFIDTIIEAGKTKNFKGNEAQVAVRQIVNEVLQREGEKRLVADPNLRREIEEKIVISRGLVQDLMDKNLQSTRNQLDEAVNRSNEGHNEPDFPSIKREDPGAGSTYTSGFDQTVHRGPGRPKKTV